MNIVRRYGTAPAQRGCGANNSCPDVLLTDAGGFLVIGKVPRPDQLLPALRTDDANIGPDENAVFVPADVLLAAARQIADDDRLSTTA